MSARNLLRYCTLVDVKQKNMKILIIGGSGTIGTQIMSDWLMEGYEKKIDHQIINLSRHHTAFGGVGVATFVHLIWDGQKIPELDFVPEYIINLAGAGKTHFRKSYKIYPRLRRVYTGA